MAWIWAIANLDAASWGPGRQGQGWEFLFMPLMRDQGQMLRKADCLLCSLWDSRARAGGPECAKGHSLLGKAVWSLRAVMSQILGQCVHGFIPVHILTSQETWNLSTTF